MAHKYLNISFREEIEKQEAKRRYQELHMAGKTEEAQADLARLAIIRKQREEAAKKKAEEAKGEHSCKVVVHSCRTSFSLH